MPLTMLPGQKFLIAYQEEMTQLVCTTCVEFWHSWLCLVYSLLWRSAVVQVIHADVETTYIVPLVTVAGGVIPVIQHGIAILCTMDMGQLAVGLLDLYIQEVLLQAVMTVAVVEVTEMVWYCY